MSSRFCSNKRICRSILRSIRYFRASKRRSCRPICCSNFWRAGRGIASHTTKHRKFLEHSRPKGQPASARTGSAAEKLLHLTKETRGFRLGRGGRQLVEFHQQLALLFGEALRRLNHDL